MLLNILKMQEYSFENSDGLIESFKSILRSVLHEEQESIREIIREEFEKNKKTMDKKETFMNRAEAAKRLGCSLPTLDDHRKNENLKAVKRGGRIFIAESEILRFAGN